MLRACYFDKTKLRFFAVAILGVSFFLNSQTYAQKTRRPAAKPTAKASANQQVAKSGAAKSKIVAVINAESITRSKLANECLRRHGKIVLESVLNKYLIIQECQRRKIRITNEQINEEIATIAKKFSLSPDRWLTLLSAERNISPTQYREDIIFPSLALKQLVATKLEVSPEELKKEFETEYGERVQVRMISLKSQASAQKVLAKVKANPAEFGEVAKEESQDVNSASARGLIPAIRKHIGDPNIERIAFGLKEGQISPIIPFAGQFIILKCEQRIPAADISPAHREVAQERLRDRILDRMLRDEAAKLSESLQANAKVTNVFNDPKKSKQMPGVAALINGQKITTARLGEECIKRHGVEVLESLINQRLLSQALKRRGIKVEKPDLEGEIAQAAELYGKLTPDGKPDVQSWLKEVKEREGISLQTYVDDAVWPSVALKKLVKDRVKITDEDLKKGFAANYGAGVDVLAIVVGNQRVAQTVWQNARANPTKAYFAELAAEYSTEPVSRANMGQVPPIRRHSGQKLVEDEAFRLGPKNPLSGIVAIGDRFIIMYYLGRTKPVVDSLDDVKSELAREISDKKMRYAMANEFERLRESAQIDNFLAGTTQSGTARAQQPSRSSPSLANPVKAKQVSTRKRATRRR